jgi:translocation and assembly module TamA
LGLALLAPPAWAQRRQTDAELQALIPDAAVAKPEEWAKAPPPVPAQEAPPVPAQDARPVPAQDAPPAKAEEAAKPVEEAPLRPDSPLPDIAGLDVPWPEDKAEPPILLSDTPDASDPLVQVLAQASASGAAIPDGKGPDGKGPDGKGMVESVLASGRAHLVWPAAGFELRGAIEDKFKAYSALQGTGPRDAEAMAQIVVRGTSDRKLLVQLLRLYGFYDGEVTQSPIFASGSDGETGIGAVRFDIAPGVRYKLASVSTGKLEATAYPIAELPIKTGTPIDGEALDKAAGEIGKWLGNHGYPFAKVPAPALTIDHANDSGDVDIAVEPAGTYVFGGISSANPRFLSARHLSDIARFRAGQSYEYDKVEDLRRAMLATSLVSGVTVTPRETRAPQGDTPGEVALDVAFNKAPLHTIAGELGYDTGEGARIGTSWEHRNLLPPEGSLKLRGILGTNEQLLGATVRKANFHGRDRQLTFDVYANNATLTSYAARKVAFATSYERLTNLLFQKPWTWSVGLEAQASEEREGVPSGVTKGRILYLTAALPMRASIDRTKDLLDPVRGYRWAIRISPEISRARVQFSPYVKVQLDASTYRKTGPVVWAGRLRLATLAGTDINDVAPSRRLYAGGGASIRGYGYNLVGPRNELGEPKGGRSLYEASLEARINTGLMGHKLQLVPFLDGGNVEAGIVPIMRDWRFGAGLGLRYQTDFGPIRLDLGTPLNPRAGDSRIGVYVALGQAF